MTSEKASPCWRVHVPSEIGPVDHLVPNDLVGGDAPLVTLCGLTVENDNGARWGMICLECDRMAGGARDADPHAEAASRPGGYHQGGYHQGADR